MIVFRGLPVPVVGLNPLLFVASLGAATGLLASLSCFGEAFTRSRCAGLVWRVLNSLDRCGPCKRARVPIVPMRPATTGRVRLSDLLVWPVSAALRLTSLGGPVQNATIPLYGVGVRT